jgi:DNA mismatch repair protein MutS
VLGYFIEVTQGNAGPMTDSPEAKARFIHRQTMANAMRFTTTELADLETKIANAADRALTIELASLRQAVGNGCASRGDQGRRAALAVWTCRLGSRHLPKSRLLPSAGR